MGDTPNPFTWNGAYGYEWLAEVGLYHVGARAYDPRTARWLQRDPMDAASGDPNLYRYCGGDPINTADPDGQDTNWGKLIDIGVGFIPIVGSLRDVGKGIAEGDWTRVAIGTVGLAIDVATLGAGRAAMGAVRAGVAAARTVRGTVDCRALVTLVICSAKGVARQISIHLDKLGFASEQKLMAHFRKHGHEFMVRSKEEYLEMAKAFASRADQAGVWKHIGQFGEDKGKIYLYDPCTNEFAVIAPDGKTLLTYFRPDRGKEYWQKQLDK